MIEVGQLRKFSESDLIDPDTRGALLLVVESVWTGDADEPNWWRCLIGGLCADISERNLLALTERADAD